MMKKLFIPLFVLTLSQSSNALDINKVLNSYKIDTTIKELDAKNSIFKEVNLRFGQSTQDENSTKQKRNDPAIDRESGDETTKEVSLRFSLNAFSNYSNKSELAKVQNQRFHNAQLEQQNKELSTLYKAYIRLHFGLQEHKRLKELLETHKDTARVSKVLLKKGKLFITDVIAAEKNISDTFSLVRVKEEEIKNTKILLAKLTNLKIKERKFSSKNSFINVNKIVSMVKQASKLNFSNLEVKKAQLEYEIEKAEAEKFVDFIEFSSSTSTGSSVSRNKVDDEITDTDSDEINTGIKISFKIPFFTDKSKVHEKRITKLRKEHEAKMENEASLESLDEIKQELIGLVESLRSLLGSSYLKRTKRYLRIYKNSKGVSPFRLLQLKSILTETEIKQAQIESQIYNKYISFLETRGSLARHKDQNVLSPKFKGEG